MNPHLSIIQAVDQLVNQISRLHSNYNDKINKQRGKRPRIYDADALADIGHLITWIAIGFVMREWWDTRDLAEAIKADRGLCFNSMSRVVATRTASSRFDMAFLASTGYTSTTSIIHSSPLVCSIRVD